MVSDKTSVSKHERTRNGKTYKVKEHKRNIKYKPVGFYELGLDEKGKFGGSRIIQNKAAENRESKPSEIINEEIQELETKYVEGKIDREEYYNKLNNLLTHY